jgi:UDP-N-acetylmuramoylalanine--D-glutamate ligase
VLNADDAPTRALALATSAPIVWFSRQRELAHGVFVRAGLDRGAAQRARRGDLPAVRRSSCAAAQRGERARGHGVRACGPASRRRRSAGDRRFRGVAHRIELVRDLAGVQYYNDSKGTNVDSTLEALDSFAERIVLIAGGKGKGQDFKPLAAARARPQCRSRGR